VEKPKEFVSDLAMIGIYYFRDGERLHKELQYLIDNDVIKSGEYQLPDALRRLTESGVVFKPGTVSEWLDCGNKEVTVHTNQRVLAFDQAAGLSMQDASAECVNSVIIQPCFIGKNVKIHASVIGPHVSIGANSVVENSIIRNTNIQQNTQISNANIADSMLGSNVVYKGRSKDLSLGDFSTTHE
jgi:glucose-1-phosphate thymidylyltransferase